MINLKKVESQLGFDVIKEVTKQHCYTEIGTRLVDGLSYSVDAEKINHALIVTKEFLALIQSEEDVPLIEVKDIAELLSNSTITGMVFSANELVAVHQSIRIYNTFKSFFFGKKKANYPRLSTMINAVYIDEELALTFDNSLDTEGHVLDNASPELLKIRKSLYSRKANIREKLTTILRQAIKNGYADEGVQPTIINGRMVLPIRSGAKRIMKGLVHDESSTGATVYFEPSEIVDDNNMAKELAYEALRQERKIMLQLSGLIAREAESLAALNELLGALDFIHAKAKVALRLDADLPKLRSKPTLSIRRGMNPILQLNKVNPVPLTISLHEEQKFVIITGPNAGGKSVCLKTIGLLQYMVQSGYLIPCDTSSEMGVFNQFLVDIGDNQSIDNELSTYSAHLTFMRHAIEEADDKTLLLIDEIGGGTSPEYGGVIAEVLLEKALSLHLKGVTTTHFSNLKEFADKKDTVINGAMLYDVQSLSPLYQLELGKPGYSFALELMQKVGFQKKTLEQVKKKADKQVLDLEATAKKLESEYVLYKQRAEEVERIKTNLSSARNEYEELKKHFDKKKKEIIQKAKKEALTIVESAQNQSKALLKEIKAKEKIKDAEEVKRKLIEQKKEIQQSQQVGEKEEPIILKKEGSVTNLKIGDFVRVISSGIKGEVIKIKNQKIQLRVGDINATVDKSEIMKIGVVTQEVTKQRVADTMMQNKLSLSHELDVRGKRGIEAIQEVERYMDNVIVSDLYEVRIIHGKGEGILRNLVRQKLNEYKKVSYQDEHADQGGVGVTVVSISE